MRHDVLVAIVNYRSSDYLGQLLRSVLAEPGIIEIVVRDNGSGPGETEALRALEAEHPTVRFVGDDRNLGFGGGVNAAVAAARSAWTDVWVLNPDAVVRPGALEILLEHADREGWGVTSPLVVQRGPQGEDQIWFAGGQVDLVHGRSSHGGLGRPVTSIDWDFREVGFVSGAAPLITRATWTRLHGFAEHYFLYWEDADLCVRATAAGIRLGIVASAVVEHEQGGSSGGGVGPTYCFYIQRNRLWLLPDARSRFHVAFLEGGAETRGLLLLPFRTGKRVGSPLPAVWASVRGLVAGLLGPRAAASPTAP